MGTCCYVTSIVADTISEHGAETAGRAIFRFVTVSSIKAAFCVVALLITKPISYEASGAAAAGVLCACAGIKATRAIAAQRAT